MTITESELREILNGDEGDGRNRGVTVAGVHRRVRAIRRRRGWAVAAAAATALTVAVTLNPPAVGSADIPGTWTGVMARPSSTTPTTTPTTSRPLGGPFPGSTVASRDYRTGGTREALRITSGKGPLTATLLCSGPLRRAVVWLGAGPPRRLLCGADSNGYGLVIQEDQSAMTIEEGAGERVVYAAVLPGEVDSAGKETVELIEGMDDLFEGWQEQLAEADPFPLRWSLTARKMISPVCRGNVRQVDPRTGEVFRLACEGGATPPSTP